jgi:hypothetical protein
MNVSKSYVMKVENYEKENVMKEDNYDEKKNDDMESRRKLLIDEYHDVKYDFLSNGDIVACNNCTISIYSTSDWKRKAKHKLDRENKIFCGVTNDWLSVISR